MNIEILPTVYQEYLLKYIVKQAKNILFNVFLDTSPRTFKKLFKFLSFVTENF